MPKVENQNKSEKRSMMKDPKGQVVLYKNHLEVRLERDSVWLTQKQMSELFDTERSVITKHLRNIVKTKELEEKSVCANYAHTVADGKIRQLNINLSE